MTSYILQLLEMENKKITVLKSSLQAPAASLLALLQLYETLRENGKLKEKLKYIHYLLFPSLTPNVLVEELDILNVNLTSQISLYL